MPDPRVTTVLRTTRDVTLSDSATQSTNDGGYGTHVPESTGGPQPLAAHCPVKVEANKRRPHGGLNWASSMLDAFRSAAQEARACWASPSDGLVSAGLLQLDQLALEVRLQMGAVVTFEGSQLFDLFLQHATLVTEPLKHLGLLLLGLGDQRVGLGDERVGLGLACRHELVVFGLTGREKLFLPRRGFTNNLVVA